MFRRSGCNASRGERKRALDVLVLDNMELAYAQRTYMTAIDFGELVELSIQNCANASNVLSPMSQMFETRPSRLRGFHIDSNALEPDSDTLLDFLQTFSVLEELSVTDNSGQLVFDPRDLRTHEATLKSLIISLSGCFTPTKHRTMTTECLREHVLPCQQLQQLALALPAICISDARVGRIGVVTPQLDVLAQLPRLQVLRIVTWPLAPDPYQEWQAEPNDCLRAHYARQLHGYAGSIVRHMQARSPKAALQLKVLGFGDLGAEDGPWKRESGNFLGCLEPIYYSIERSVDRNDKAWLRAVLIEEVEIRYRWPVYDICPLRVSGADQGLGFNGLGWQL